MKTLVFATNNKHKLEEISSLTARGFHIVSLAETGCTEDIPETEPTLEGNALLKARYVHSRYGHDCFTNFHWLLNCLAANGSIISDAISHR